MDDLLAELAAIAKRHIAPERAACLDDPNAELGLSSLAAVEFLVDIEESLSVQLPADAIDAATFRTLQSVADCVRALRNPTRSGAAE